MEIYVFFFGYESTCFCILFFFYDVAETVKKKKRNHYVLRILEDF